MIKANSTLALKTSRYELLLRIASGGMAIVYVGRLRGAAGFSRFVAIKRAHPHLLEDVEMRRMLVQEAKVASTIHHANVVSVLDVEESVGELLLVMDYIEGGSLTQLLRAAGGVPPEILVRIVLDACAGLQAAHELNDEAGNPLSIVHRDVSPQNILIGTDGVAKLADFGIAKALEGVDATTTGVLKGKVRYMAPEYVTRGAVDARADLFGVGVVLWEGLAGRPLFRGSDQTETFERITKFVPPKLSSEKPALAPLDDIVDTLLAKEPGERFQSARALITALHRTAAREGLLASHGEVADFVKLALGVQLEQRRASIRQLDAVEEPATESLRLPPRIPEEEAPGPPPSSSEHSIDGRSMVAVAAPASEAARVSAIAPHAGRKGRFWALVVTAGLLGAGLLVAIAGLWIKSAQKMETLPSTTAGPAPNAALAAPRPSVASEPPSAQPSVSAAPEPAKSTESRPLRAPVSRPPTTRPGVAPNPYKTH